MINVLTAGGIKLRTPREITGRSALGWGVAFILLLLFLSHSPAAGRVYHYRDNQGVLHITNVPPAGEGEANGDAPPEMVPGRSQRMAAPRLRGAGIGPAPSPSSLSSEGGITRLVDAQGVITITNKESAAKPGEPAVHKTGAAAPAGANQEEEEEEGEEEEEDDKAGQPKAPALALPSPPAIKQGPEGFPQDQRPGQVMADVAAASGLGLSKSGGHIRRFRDENGVWHIVNDPPPLMASSRPLPLKKEPEAAETAFPGAGGPQPRGLLEVTRAEAMVAGTQNPSRVMAYKKKGVLHVSNDPPQLAQAGQGRGDGRRGPPESLEPFIQEAALKHRLPAALVCAIIQEESNFIPGAVSPKGAQGLMQLMPGTAAFLGVRDPLNPRENILGGCAYFRLLLNFFQESLPLALAAYNAGYMRVVAADYRIPALKETQEFVYRVLGRYYLNERQGLLARNI